MSSIHRPIRRDRRNRGLATLEMVLALPILLLLMALMVNFGTIACWKIRALSVARNAVWGNRSPRTTGNSPRPSYWPSTAGMGTAALPSDTELDGPRSNLLVPVGLVGLDIMDPTVGLLQGNAHLTRHFPMLRKMPQFDLRAKTELLCDTWEYKRMGLGDNTSCRIPLVYTLPAAYEEAMWAQAYSAARKAILDLFQKNKDLWPLDRDEEWIFYSRIIHSVDPRWPLEAPDFHPGLNGFCSLDKELADARVNDLIDRIQGRDDPRVPDVAERMTVAFIDLYRRTIEAYQRLLGARPPPSQTEIAAMRAEIKQLEKKIDTLEQFLKTLQQ